jgi:hypothetical protein
MKAAISGSLMGILPLIFMATANAQDFDAKACRENLGDLAGGSGSEMERFCRQGEERARHRVAK